MSDNGSARKGNGFRPKQAKLWMGEVEKKMDRLLELRMEYMADCKEVREEIKDNPRPCEGLGHSEKDDQGGGENP